MTFAGAGAIVRAMANYDKTAAAAEDRFCNELSEAQRTAGMDLLCRLFPMLWQEASDPNTAGAVDGFVSIAGDVLKAAGAGLLLNPNSTLDKLADSLKRKAPTVTAYMQAAVKRARESVKRARESAP